MQQALLEGQVGLATLAGAGMPQFAIEPEAAPANPFGVFREGGPMRAFLPALLLMSLALTPASAAEEGSVLVTTMWRRVGSSLPDIITAYKGRPVRRSMAA